MKPVDPIAVLRQFVSTHPSQLAAAAALGISPTYLSDMLNKRRDVSARVLAKLGLKTVVIQS